MWTRILALKLREFQFRQPHQKGAAAQKRVRARLLLTQSSAMHRALDHWVSTG